MKEIRFHNSYAQTKGVEERRLKNETNEIENSNRIP
jgi:hypothetical protein